MKTRTESAVDSIRNALANLELYSNVEACRFKHPPVWPPAIKQAHEDLCKALVDLGGVATFEADMITLHGVIANYAAALKKVSEWKDFPSASRNGDPCSYETAFGIYGAITFMRKVAAGALQVTPDTFADRRVRFDTSDLKVPMGGTRYRIVRMRDPFRGERFFPEMKRHHNKIQQMFTFLAPDWEPCSYVKGWARGHYQSVGFATLEEACAWFEVQHGLLFSNLHEH